VWKGYAHFVFGPKSLGDFVQKNDMTVVYPFRGIHFEGYGTVARGKREKGFILQHI
jgi:hypothetical protein